jgi:uncharacterized protein
MRALLDVNVLLALLDGGHVHHSRARAWWIAQKDERWSSCPMTQNGLIRVVSQPRYSKPRPLLEAIHAFRTMVALPSHEFWPDDISIADPNIFDHGRILGPNQITDVYLLALAVKHGGRLATFDRGIPFSAVRGAEPRHVAII